jgi:3,2-trans-enoyl-CoA isomerase
MPAGAHPAADVARTHRLYRSRLVTVAAIRGQCPAGGCGLAMCCDFRIATPDTVMGARALSGACAARDGVRAGLNEVAIGIAVPNFWTKASASCICVSRMP